MKNPINAFDSISDLFSEVWTAGEVDVLKVEEVGSQAAQRGKGSLRQQSSSYLSLYLTIYIHMYLSIYLSTYLPTCLLPIYLSIYL